MYTQGGAGRMPRPLVLVFVDELTTWVPYPPRFRGGGRRRCVRLLGWILFGNAGPL